MSTIGLTEEQVMAPASSTDEVELTDEQLEAVYGGYHHDWDDRGRPYNDHDWDDRGRPYNDHDWDDRNKPWFHR